MNDQIDPLSPQFAKYSAPPPKKKDPPKSLGISLDQGEKCQSVNVYSEVRKTGERG